MREYQLQNPIKCKCGSNTYHIDRAPLNGSGPMIDTVICSNNQCKTIFGQLEPSSITSNLSQINQVMAKVAEALEKLNLGQGNPQQGIPQKESPPEKPVGMTGSQPAPAKPNPAADPSSSDPEADQSPV
jgi:hypothetical protein